MIAIDFNTCDRDCIAAILRAYYTWRLVEETDYSWNTSIQGMCTALEMSFGILVATLPIAPRFYKHLKQNGLIPNVWGGSGLKESQENQAGPQFAKKPSVNGKKDSRWTKSVIGVPGLKSYGPTPNNTRYARSDSGLYSEIPIPGRAVVANGTYLGSDPYEKPKLDCDTRAI